MSKLRLSRKDKEEKGNWIVTMRCVVTKSVYCSNCTEQQAQDEPWEHASDEQEMDQVNWEVLKVEVDK